MQTRKTLPSVAARLPHRVADGLNFIISILQPIFVLIPKL